MTEPERLHRLLDSLRFPPPVAEAVIDAPRHPGEKFKRAH